MTVVLAICVGVTFGVSVLLMLGRELKGIAMGVFLIGHAANLSIIAMSGSPITSREDGTIFKEPPILTTEVQQQAPNTPQLLDLVVDPLPQALILTAIVIGFAVMAFLLTLIVQTARATKTLEVDDLAEGDA